VRTRAVIGVLLVAWFYYEHQKSTFLVRKLNELRK